MAYSVKILADSINENDNRLTTMEVVLPRIILPEFNTHRMFSRNSASSRAIPIEKMIKRVIDDPFIPEYWGENQKGMQAVQQISHAKRKRATIKWLTARDNAVAMTNQLAKIGVHKQITNRLLEPFMWQTIIVSATEWENFFNLRTHPDAQPEIQTIARMMKKSYEENVPTLKKAGEWHMPLLQADEFVSDENEAIGFPCTVFTTAYAKKVSAGRCARVSYLTHDGKRDPAADVVLAERLIESGHMSPMEHVAQSLACPVRRGNFVGWLQFRKTIKNEDVFKVKS
jgi:thymidylate synthase ThyX